MPALHGVMVTYRRPAVLESTFAQLSAQERRLDTLVVVDNDPDESARTCTAHLSEGAATAYVASGDNLGPAGGIALGMAQILGFASDDDWILLLDDDNPPRTPDLFGELESFGTRIRSADRRTGAVGLTGGQFDVRRGRSAHVPDSQLTGSVSSAWIGGGHLPMYSVHAVRAAGVFDKRLFFGFDDLEYGLRLGAHDFGVYAHGDLWRRERLHYGLIEVNGKPAVALEGPSWRRYYSVRNLIYILRQYGHPAAAALVAARSLAKPLANLPAKPSLALAHLRLTLRAVADAQRGFMGRTVEPPGGVD